MRGANLSEITSKKHHLVDLGSRQTIVIGIFLVILALWIVGSLFIPQVPYQSENTLIYPLLLIYKDYLFVLGTAMLIVIVGFGLLFKILTTASFDSLQTLSLLLLLTVTAVFPIKNIFTPDYRHHDRIEVGEYIYQLGSSHGPDWPTLQYLVYQCDQNGLICKLITIPHLGIDRSQLPSGTQSDRGAMFLMADNNNLFISIHDDKYPVSFDNPLQ